MSYTLILYFDLGNDYVQRVGHEEFHDKFTFDYFRAQLGKKEIIKTTFHPEIEENLIGMAQLEFPYSHILSGPDGKTLHVSTKDRNSFKLISYQELKNSQLTDEIISRLDKERISELIKTQKS